MFGNVWVVSLEFDGLLRFGEAIQHDAVIDGDARKTEQMHERHAAIWSERFNFSAIFS